jgi:hypothetical protein
VTKGLDVVVPRRNVYLEALGGWSSLGGPILRAEAGARLGENVGMFAFGEWTRPESIAGVGARITW